MRNRYIAVLAVLTVALLAACGNASSLKGASVKVEATPTALRQAADKTIAQGPTHVSYSVAMTVDGHSVTIPGEGDFDPARHLARMTMNMSSLADQVGGDAAGFASLFAKPITVVISGTTMYMSFPALASLAGSDKEWVKIDLAAKNQGIADLLGGAGTDPTNFLDYLKGTGQVTDVGKEDVGGVPTTHFSGSYTLQQALDSVPADKRAALESLLSKAPAGSETKEIPYDVWVDADGLVRRIKMGFDMSGTQNATGATATMTMEFSNYGKPVDITVPSDDKVTDLTAMIGAFSDGSKFSSVGSSIN